MSFPGFNSIYTLSDPLINPPFRGTVETTSYKARALVRGEVNPKTPIVMRYQMGGVSKDFIWTTNVGVMMVNRKVVDLLKANGFKGWDTYPVEVHGKNDETIKGYYGIAITGRCGPIDNSKSKTVMVNYPAGKFPMLRGMYFNPSPWDGSDLFMTSTPSLWLCVLEQVKKVFEKAKISNVMFESVTEIDRDPKFL